MSKLKTLISIILLNVIFHFSFCQDQIILNNFDTLNVKILSIDKSKIKYEVNTDSNIFNELSKSDLIKIVWRNKKELIFDSLANNELIRKKPQLTFKPFNKNLNSANVNFPDIKFKKNFFETNFFIENNKVNYSEIQDSFLTFDKVRYNRSLKIEKLDRQAHSLFWVGIGTMIFGYTLSLKPYFTTGLLFSSVSLFQFSNLNKMRIDNIKQYQIERKKIN